jgi:TonB-linked SusC/RagA family outer membrane protein
MMKKVYSLIGLLLCISIYAQEPVKIQGTVVDFITSAPVVGADIRVKGGVGVNTIVSEDGHFEMEIPSLHSALLVSFPGYWTKEYFLSGKEEVRIELIRDDLQAGESMVRLPYYTSNEKNLNGAYTALSKGYDQTIQYRDINQMLQGSIAGLEVGSYSGVPDEGARYNLRGIHSLYGTNAPLFVVDGVPLYDQVFEGSVAAGNLYNFLSDVNVKDIESVVVMRDAAATGIYGSRAANGVIVINTKEGTQGKTYFDVSIQQGISGKYREIPVMNSSEYLPYLAEKLYGRGYTSDYVGSFPPFSGAQENTQEYWKYANNTNWQDIVTRNAWYQDYYLNLRGGDATSKYSLNAGYSDMQGVVRGVSSNRFSTRFNLEFKLLKRLTAGLHIAFSRTSKDLMDQGYEERVNPLYLSLVKPTIFSPYQKTAYGVNTPFLSQPDYDGLSNPLAVISGVSNEILNTSVFGNVFVQYDFSRFLKTRVTLSLDRRGLEEDRFTPANGIVPDRNDYRFDRVSHEQFYIGTMMAFEHTLTFEKQLLPEHWLRAFGGYNFEVNSYVSEYGITIHASSDDFKGLGDGQKYAMGGRDDAYHNVSFFANGDYTFREKLLLRAGLRVDGSSRFGPDNSFAWLPYAGATYRLKAESFLNDVSFVDELNLRASWGLTANQDIPVTARYSLHDVGFYTTRPGSVPYTTGNPSIKWESTVNYNAGIDLSLFKKWLGVRFDFFNTKTTDLLLPNKDALNAETVYSWSNGGALTNNGFELGINTLGRSGDFVWNAGVNIAKYLSKVSDLPNGMPVIDGDYGFTSIVQDGREAGLIYGYKHLGVFGATAEAAGLLNDRGIAYQGGDFHYQDVNHDNIINEADMQVIGNPNPDFFGGITAGVNYKRFGLDALFSYSYGNDVLNVLRMKLENGAGYENQSKTVLNRWQDEGDVTNIPNTAYGDPAGNRAPSSCYIEDGSYFKLKTLTVSYNIDSRISFVRNLQIYLTAYNLFSINKYLGWDPEITVGHNIFTRGYDFGNYPLPRSFMVGLKIGL